MREFVDSICQQLQARLPMQVVEFDGQRDAVVIDGYYLWVGRASAAMECGATVEQCADEVLSEYLAVL